MLRPSPLWAGNKRGASPALGTRKPLEKSQTWTGPQVFESLILKGSLAPCSSGPLSLRVGTMPCLAIIGICETEPAWGPWLGMPLPPPAPCSAQALDTTDFPSLGFRLILEA